jgi:hypothetical protein
VVGVEGGLVGPPEQVVFLAEIQDLAVEPVAEAEQALWVVMVQISHLEMVEAVDWVKLHFLGILEFHQHMGHRDQQQVDGLLVEEEEVRELLVVHIHPVALAVADPAAAHLDLFRLKMDLMQQQIPAAGEEELAHRVLQQATEVLVL